VGGLIATIRLGGKRNFGKVVLGKISGSQGRGGCGAKSGRRFFDDKGFGTKKKKFK